MAAAYEWKSIAQSEQFSSLSTEQKIQVRDRFFEKHLAPSVPQDAMGQVRERFNAISGIGVTAELGDRSVGEWSADIGTSVGVGASNLIDNQIEFTKAHPVFGIWKNTVGRVYDAVGIPQPQDLVQQLTSTAGSWLKEQQSPQKQAADAAVQSADGFGATLGALADNPEFLPTFVAEQVPSFVGPLAAVKGANMAGVTGKAALSAVALGTGAQMEGAGAASDIGKKIDAMSDEQLAQLSPMYQAAVERGATPEQARYVLKTAAQQAGAAFAGAVAAGAGKIFKTGDLAADFVTGKVAGASGKIVAGAATGIAKESGEETVTEGGVQLTSNLATKVTADSSASLTEGVGSAAALGLVGGGVAGGPMGAVAARPAKPPIPTNKPGGMSLDEAVGDDIPVLTDEVSVRAAFALPHLKDETLYGTPGGELIDGAEYQNLDLSRNNLEREAETAWLSEKARYPGGRGFYEQVTPSNLTHTAPQAVDAPSVPVTLPQVNLLPAPEAAVAAPEESALDKVAHEAATSPLNDLPEPTEAQKDAGNYKKGHVKIHGLDVAIENPKGSKRSGTSPDGTTWESEMASHYGYVKRTTGADGDQVDVFVGANPESQKVFVVDQVNQDGEFDEHKVMLGFNSQEEADTGYHANYSEGWTGRGEITEMSMDQFKDWLKNGETTKPVRYQPPQADAKNSEQKSGEEVQARLEAIKRQARRSGWTYTMVTERKRLESLLPESGPAQTPEAVAAPTQEPVAAPDSEQAGIKWFGTKQKAEAYVTKKKLGGTHEVVAAGKSRFEVRERATVKESLTAQAEKGNQESLAEDSIPEIVEVKDRYGVSYRVKKRDLDGNLEQIKFLTKDGKVKGTIHRDNIDLTGEKQADARREMESNPFFDVVTTPHGATFRTVGAAKQFAAKNGYSETHTPRPASEFSPAARGFVLARRAGGQAEAPGVDIGQKAAANSGQAAPAPTGKPIVPESQVHGVQASWVIRNRESGEVVMETFDKKKVAALNTEKYEAVPVAEHLAGLSSAQKTPPNQKGGDRAAAKQSEKTHRAPGRADPGEEGYTLLDARNDLIEARTKTEGQVVDDRVVQRVHQLEKLVKEMEAAPSANTLVSDDRAAELRKRLKDKLKNQLNSGIDPEIMAIGAELAVYHIERGARTFVAFAQNMAADLGTSVQKLKPYLRSWYNGARDMMEDMGGDVVGMESPDAVRAQLATIDHWREPAQNLDSTTEDVQPGEGNDRQPSAENSGAGAEGPQPEQTQVDDGNRKPDNVSEQPDGRVRRERGGRKAGRSERGHADAGGDGAGAGTEHAIPGDRARRTGAGDRADRRNYRIQKGELKRSGSWKATAEQNIRIVELVKQINAEGRPATAEEKALLTKFTGWGASEIANGVFPNQHGQYKDGWRELGERLQAALSPEEYDQAKRTTQYAHYTSEPIIRSVYGALDRMGFSGGALLEPGMGIGLFNGLMPDAMAASSSYTGVEYDSITGSIAKLLYPESNIVVGDFTTTKLPRDFFDAAIGNPPFGQIKIQSDPEYKKQGFLLHDYFFAKTIDRVKPGGLLVFVTSKGTMDKANDRARRYLSERADLVGAIRLPQTAFKDNAGTEVVTDVIFLRKRLSGETTRGAVWSGLAEVETAKGPAMVNEYFAAHPEMVLGRHAKTGSMYRADEYTVEPIEGDIEELFTKAIQNLPEGIYRPERGSKAEAAAVQKRDYDPKVKKEGGIYVSDDGNLMQVESGQGVPLTTRAGSSGNVLQLKPREIEWLKGFVSVRDALKQAQYDQLNDGQWESSLSALNKAYNDFVEQHGQILAHTVTERESEDGSVTVTRRMKNEPLFRIDAEGALAYSLEVINPDGSISKGPILNGRTLNKPVTRNITNTQDATFVSLNELGRFDIGHIAKLAGKSEADVIADLGNEVFEDPSAGWTTADEYLSGNVVRKLKEAESAARLNKQYARNVEALKAVQPRPLAPHDITVQLGTAWIPAADVANFAAESMGAAFKVAYSPVTGQWSVAGQSNGVSEWGTKDKSAGDILEGVLNNRQLKITYRDSEGKTHTDPEGTEKVNDIAKKLRAEFKRWIWTDTHRADRLAKFYNENFNNIAPRKFDGSHLTLPGISSRFNLRPHQKRAIWRTIQQGDTYYAHAVGAGKTFTMIAAGMEERRLGLVKKPMYVVPNHMLAQFSKEFLELYPTASIMVADEQNFHTHSRRKFVAQAALNDPDAIVITHSAFGRIGMSPEYTESFLKARISEWQDAMEETDGNDRVTRKQIERRIEQLENRLKAILDGDKKDRLLTFEELGVDRLYVDEGHEYRKLDFPTNRGSIKGIDSSGSQKAMDLFMKVEYLRGRNPARALVMASGTPVTNTMGELFTVQRYFQPAQLEEDGDGSFDAWASHYGEVVDGLEQNAAGGYESVSRFAKFVNVPELMSRVRSFMDILTSSQLGDLVQRPEVESGGRQVVVTPVPDGYKEYQKELERRIRVIRERKGPPKPGQDIILSVIADGRFSAIDMRFVDHSLPSDPNSKLNRMLDDMIKVYHNTAENEYVTDGKVDPIKGASLMLFTDIGLGEQSAASRGFDMKGWIERRLTEGGVKPAHVAFMRDHKAHSKKERLFDDMRRGHKRILIGGKDMETGVNAQKRLAFLAHLDAPWFPASVEQREGRIIRQGNQNKQVAIKAYATKGSYDSTMWGMNARKARFIEQAMSGDSSVRSMEDVSEASAFEMAAALASGDERYLKLAGLKGDVERLGRLYSAHQRDQKNLRSSKHDSEAVIKRNIEMVEQLKAAVAKRQPIKAGEFAGVVDGKRFDSRDDFSAALFAAFKALAESYTAGEQVVGEIGGFNIKYHGIELRGSNFAAEVSVDIPDSHPLINFPIDPEMSVAGISARAANQVNGLDREITKREGFIAEHREKIEKIARRVGASFPEAAELAEKSEALAAIEAELAAESASQEGGELTEADRVPAAAEPVDDVMFQADATETYSDAIDRIFADRPKPHHVVLVSKSNPILTALGYKHQPVVMHEAKINKNKYVHHMKAEHYKRLPELLRDPVAVYESDTHPGRLVFLLDDDINGQPITAALEPDQTFGRGAMVVTYITSAYEKDGWNSQVVKAAEAGTIKYLNKKKSRSFGTTIRLQLPSVVHQRAALGSKILTERDLVKPGGSEFDAIAPGETLRGSPKELVDQWVAPVVASWGDVAPRVRVIQSLRDAPAELLTAAESVLKSGRFRAVQHGGTVYLVADAIPNKIAALKSLAHETRAHWGMRIKNETEYQAAIERINWASKNNKYLRGLRARVLAELKTAEQTDSRVAEEVLAKVAEDMETGKPVSDFVQKLVASFFKAVRTFLRKIGFRVPWSTTELRALVLEHDRLLRSNEQRTPPKGQGIDSPLFQPDGSAREEPEVYAKRFDDVLKQGADTAMGRARDWLAKGSAVDASKRGALMALTLRQLADIGKHALPQIGRYVNVVHKIQSERNVMAERAATIAEEWMKWAARNRKMADKMHRLMHDATIEQVDPSKQFVSLREHLEARAEAVMDQLKTLSGEGFGRGGRLAQKEDGGRGTQMKRQLFEELKSLRAQIKAEPARRQAHARLAPRWESLSPEAKAMYVRVRKEYKTRHEKFKGIMVDRIMAAEISEKARKEMLARLLYEFESQELAGPYFPLARFGRYWLESADENGERVFLTFESEAECNRAAKNLAKAGFPVTTGHMLDNSREMSGASLGFINDLVRLVEDSDLQDTKANSIMDDIYQLYLQSLPDRSMRKSFVHRHSIKGYTQDAVRAYAENMVKGAYQLARLSHVDDLSELMQSMRKDARKGDYQKARLYNEMQARHEWVMNPTHSAWAHKATTLGFVYMLGASPAAAAINMLQLPTVALPVLGARFGFARTAREMMKAAGRFNAATGRTNPKHLTEGEQLAMQEWIDSGVLDQTRAHDLAGLAEGGSYKYSAGTEKAMRAVSFLFHRAEQFNRDVTALAAYRMAIADGMPHGQAVRVAAELTWDSHFDYTNANRARFMQKDWQKVAFQFKNYSQHVTYYLARNLHQIMRGATPKERRIAFRQLAGTLGVTALMGGTSALPVLWAVFAILNAGLDDDDEPFDAETEFRVWLAEVLGKDNASRVLYGAGGAGLSGRISLNGLWIRDPNRDLEGEDAWANYAKQAVGPVFGGIFVNGLKGLADFSNGEYWSGTEKIMPKVIKDGMKAIRFAREGVTNSSGAEVVPRGELSTAGIVLQAMGLADSGAMEQYAENSSIKGYEQRISARRTQLMARYYMALNDGDRDELSEVVGEIGSFNQKNPGARISPASLRRSMRARRRSARESRNGIRLSRSMRHLYDDLDYAN